MVLHDTHAYLIRLAGDDEVYIANTDHKIAFIDGCELQDSNDPQVNIFKATDNEYRLKFMHGYLSVANTCKGVALKEGVEDETTLWEFHQTKNGFKLFNRCKKYYIDGSQIDNNETKISECKHFEIEGAPLVFALIDLGDRDNQGQVSKKKLCTGLGFIQRDNKNTKIIAKERRVTAMNDTKPRTTFVDSLAKIKNTNKNGIKALEYEKLNYPYNNAAILGLDSFLHTKKNPLLSLNNLKVLPKPNNLQYDTLQYKNPNSETRTCGSNGVVPLVSTYFITTNNFINSFYTRPWLFSSVYSEALQPAKMPILSASK